jgi:cysteine desulfurase family protein (TIGR01976 family)
VVRRLHFDPSTCQFRLEDLERLVNERTRLICVGGASNLTGTLHDIQAMCTLARDAGALSFVDGVQLVPHVPTDVQMIGCDFLACSAYKFFGPHQGILWSKRLGELEPIQVRPALVGPPACFELGTPSFEAMAGTTAAVNYLAWIGETMADDFLADYSSLKPERQHLHAAMAALFDYEKRLAKRLIDGLLEIPGVIVHGVVDDVDKRVPTVAITAGQTSPKALAEHLAAENIFVWHGHNYAVELVRTLGLEKSGGVVRIGPVHYNTVAEVDETLVVIERFLSH